MSVTRLAKTVIKIPKYVERGPTDILKALAGTIKHLPRGPSYPIHDDPFLLPERQFEVREYTLSYLSGQKAANYFLEKYPNLFYRDDAEPKVEAFYPSEEFQPGMEFTEEDIKWCIDNNDPINGMIAYESLVEKNSEISNETLLQLFELLCFSNGKKFMNWVDHTVSQFTKQEDRWLKTGPADKIFNQIKEDSDPPRVYSSMISGLSRFKQHAAAHQVFDDFKKIHPDKGLYNHAYDSLMRSSQILFTSYPSYNESIDGIINHMELNSVKPDLVIFNTMLHNYAEFRIDESICEKSFKLLNDMTSLNIEPSLATFAALFVIVAKFKNGVVYGEIIPDMLAYVESKFDNIQIRDDRDSSFFCETMHWTQKRLNSLVIAKRLHKLYHRQPHLFPSFDHRNRYFGEHFRLILTMDNLENILQFYEDHVPSHFRPREDHYDMLAEALRLFNAPEEVVKKIGHDIVRFLLVDRVKNDKIFRKDPEYVEAFEKRLSSSQSHN